MRSILIIEDNENLSRGISFLFEKDGFQTHVAPDLAAGRSILREQSFDLLILDLGLPDGDGIHFCAELREHSDIPIIILTARDMEIDEVSGLTAGADDYITKPFSLSVLRARVQACLRRSARLGDQCLYSGRFSLDLRRCRLFDEEKEIAVTATEFKLLSLFIRNAGQVLSKEQILDALWDVDGNFIDANTVPVNINRIRNKIEKDPRNPTVIKTIHGIGYMWDQEGTLCCWQHFVRRLQSVCLGAFFASDTYGRLLTRLTICWIRRFKVILISPR